MARHILFLGVLLAVVAVACTSNPAEVTELRKEIDTLKAQSTAPVPSTSTTTPTTTSTATSTPSPTPSPTPTPTPTSQPVATPATQSPPVAPTSVPPPTPPDKPCNPVGRWVSQVFPAFVDYKGKTFGPDVQVRWLFADGTGTSQLVNVNGTPDNALDYGLRWVLLPDGSVRIGGTVSPWLATFQGCDTLKAVHLEGVAVQLWTRQ